MAGDSRWPGSATGTDRAGNHRRRLLESGTWPPGAGHAERIRQRPHGRQFAPARLRAAEPDRGIGAPPDGPRPLGPRRRTARGRGDLSGRLFHLCLPAAEQPARSGRVAPLSGAGGGQAAAGRAGRPGAPDGLLQDHAGCA
ncbi:hypothetical protein G6F31_019819 [Rhizopus arrhizus]|nr:hypothetical protein G6F31_019819 [Rhizopus arrhizus]